MPAEISVIIPCYNCEAFVGETLESVLRQTRPAKEIIVVDDASTDRTGDVVRRFEGVTYLRLEQNRRLPGARNYGIRHSTGELIALVDSDDIWLPAHLEAVAPLLERYPETVLAFSRVVLFGDVEWEQEKTLPPGEPVDALWLQAVQNQVIPSSAIFRRSAFDAVGGFDESLVTIEDYDFFLRLARLGRFISSPAEPTVRYRKYAGQMTSHFARMRQLEWEVRERLWRQARTSEPVEFSRRFDAAMREGWAEGIERAWNARRREQLEVYLSLRDKVPDIGRLYWAWRVKCLLYPLVRLWDRLPRGVVAPLRRLRRLRR